MVINTGKPVVALEFGVSGGRFPKSMVVPFKVTSTTPLTVTLEAVSVRLSAETNETVPGTIKNNANAIKPNTSPKTLRTPLIKSFPNKILFTVITLKPF